MSTRIPVTIEGNLTADPEVGRAENGTDWTRLRVAVNDRRLNEQTQEWEDAGVVFHDVINVKHARKAAEQGVDGLILVCAGAGGHAGTLSPFALVREVKQWFKGTILLSGAISDGWSIASALALGADLAYIGTRFIATQEANADVRYKQALTEHAAHDIVYSNLFTGVHGNYLGPSIAAAGLDPALVDPVEAASLSLPAERPADAALASDVRARDLEVDQMYNALFREFLTYMMEDPRNITACMHLHFIAKNIERMGDHATSIAEQVLYLVSGELPDDPRPKSESVGRPPEPGPTAT